MDWFQSAMCMFIIFKVVNLGNFLKASGSLTKAASEKLSSVSVDAEDWKASSAMLVSGFCANDMDTRLAGRLLVGRLSILPSWNIKQVAI